MRCEIIEDGEVDEVGEVVGVGDVGEVSEVGEVGQVDEVGEVGDVGKVSEVCETGEVDEVGEVIGVVDVSEVGELGDVGEVTEDGEVGEVSEVGEVLEVSEVGEVHEVSEALRLLRWVRLLRAFLPPPSIRALPCLPSSFRRGVAQRWILSTCLHITLIFDVMCLKFFFFTSYEVFTKKYGSVTHFVHTYLTKNLKNANFCFLLHLLPNVSS